MLADLDGSSVGSHAGESAARGLKHERDDVAGDEDPVEEARVEAREGAVDEVDTGWC